MAAKKSAKAAVERGSALVARVIERIQSDEGCEIDVVDPRPLAPEVLARLTFSNGLPLPPSLKALLAYDASWVMRTLGWFHDLDEPTLEVAPVWRLVKENLGPGCHLAYKRLPSPLPDACALALDGGSESLRLLFLCDPDEAGEYPVLGVDVDDTPVVTFESPGFDTWLAAQAGVIEPSRAPWSALVKESRARLFGKKSELDCDDFADADEEDDEPAPKPAPKAQKPKKPAAPVTIKEGLPEEKLGKGLAEAIEVGDAARVDAYLAAAQQRFPKAEVWGPIALRQVVHGDDVALTRRLFAAGVSADAQGPYGAHFETACKYASIEVVRAFLDAGATIDLRCGEGKDFALGAAAEAKRLDVVQLLLERGANPNLVDDNRMAAIHHASHVFDDDPPRLFPRAVEIVRALLDAGADVNLQDGNARTALHWAIEDGNLSLVELLVARGANLELKQWAGDTALTLAVRHDRSAIVHLLRSAGARTDVKNKDGWCVDDVAPQGVAGPKDLEVRLPCGPGKHRAKLVLAASFKHAVMDAELPIRALEDLAERGCAGSDVFAPWASSVTISGGGLPNHGKGKGTWEIAYEGVAPAVFAHWLRKITGPESGFTVTKLSLVGAGEPSTSLDTERVRALLADPALEPLRAWKDPGFPVTDKGKGPKRLAWVHTRRALAKDDMLVFTTMLQLSIAQLLPRGAPTANSIYNLEPGVIAPHGFEINVRWFDKNGVFPHDPAAARAITINALAKLHHATDAILGLEWALGVSGDEGTAAPTAAEAWPVEGDAIEVSPSGRATCRTCRAAIAKGELRFVEADLMGKRYHHLKCGAKKLSKRFVAALEAYAGEVPDRDALLTLAAGDEKAAPTPGKYPYAEIAKSGRSSCLGCSKPIAKDTLRVAVERQVETPQGTMARPGYYHPACAKGVDGVTADAVLANTPGLADPQAAELRATLA